MKQVAIIVAHPDDETLWAGGTIITKPHWRSFVVCLSRADDKDRSQRFYNALKILRTEGVMGNLDDGPAQQPLPVEVVESQILKLLPPLPYDLIITHNPAGEYTRHLRHEETGSAVIALWLAGTISAKKLWTFAFEDGNGAYNPRPEKDATIHKILTKQIWMKKYDIMTNTYGFRKSSWEARIVPKEEAFRQFADARQAMQWLSKRNKKSL